MKRNTLVEEERFELSTHGSQCEVSVMYNAVCVPFVSTHILYQILPFISIHIITKHYGIETGEFVYFYSR